MSQKMESNLYAIKHLRSGINSLLRSTLSGGTPPSLAGADITTLRARLLGQQDVLDDIIQLLEQRYRSNRWLNVHESMCREGDGRHNQAQKIHEDRIAANGGKSIQDSGPAVVDCDC